MENPQKKQIIIAEIPAKQHGIRVTLLKTVEMLHLFTAGLTVKMIKENLYAAGIPVSRKTLNKLLKEIQQYPTPGYVLTIKMVRAGDSRCAAYRLIKIKKHN